MNNPDACIDELLRLRDENETLRHLAAKFLLDLTQERVKLECAVSESDSLKSALMALYFDTIGQYHSEQTLAHVRLALGIQEQPKTL